MAKGKRDDAEDEDDDGYDSDAELEKEFGGIGDSDFDESTDEMED